MCGKPTINGEPGYSWNGEAHHVRPINPPALKEGDELLYDEPGRCGGIDSHSHHFRVVKSGGSFALLVRHGGGDERIDLGGPWRRAAINGFAALDSNARYWLCLLMHSIHRNAESRASSERNHFWRTAAAEKRIKTRRVRSGVKVWVEEQL